jgi:antitoxin (DNA-binding transcriptional repressor) of toxin-antitoxin stability system
LHVLALKNRLGKIGNFDQTRCNRPVHAWRYANEIRRKLRSQDAPARLLRQVEKGEAITITKRGKPIAVLSPAHAVAEQDVSSVEPAFVPDLWHLLEIIHIDPHFHSLKNGSNLFSV